MKRILLWTALLSAAFAASPLSAEEPSPILTVSLGDSVSTVAFQSKLQRRVNAAHTHLCLRGVRMQVSRIAKPVWCFEVPQAARYVPVVVLFPRPPREPDPTGW